MANTPVNTREISLIKTANSEQVAEVLLTDGKVTRTQVWTKEQLTKQLADTTAKVNEMLNLFSK